MNGGTTNPLAHTIRLARAMSEAVWRAGGTSMARWNGAACMALFDEEMERIGRGDEKRGEAKR